MILRLVAVRLAFVFAVAAGVLTATGAVIGFDRWLAHWWPSLGPADGLVFSLSAPWAVVLVALLLAQVGRLVDWVRLPDGLGRPTA